MHLSLIHISAPEDTTDQGTNTQAVSAVNKAEVDAAKDSLDQKNEQVKEEEAAVKEAEKSVETAKANAELAKEAVKTAEEGTQACLLYTSCRRDESPLLPVGSSMSNSRSYSIG